MDRRRAIVRSAGALATAGLGGWVARSSWNRDTGARKGQPECRRTHVFIDPKSRAKTHALTNVVDGIYRRINAPATSERIHKIGVLRPQCSAVRGPSQFLTPAVDR
jgi:hypothetical protein